MHSNKDLDWLINTETQSNEEEKSKINPKAKRAMSIVGSSSGRIEHDFYPTPRYATEALLKVEKFQGNIWECAAGEGDISKVLEEYGHSVRSTELVNRGFGEVDHDFFTSPYTADNIISNPPYSLAEEFVRHSLTKVTRKVCMLLKLSFLEGIKRQKLFQETPLTRVHVFSKRLSMYREGQKGNMASGMICFCWYTWEVGYEGSPTIHWI